MSIHDKNPNAAAQDAAAVSANSASVEASSPVTSQARQKAQAPRGILKSASLGADGKPIVKTRTVTFAATPTYHAAERPQGELLAEKTQNSSKILLQRLQSSRNVDKVSLAEDREVQVKQERDPRMPKPTPQLPSTPTMPYDTVKGDQEQRKFELSLGQAHVQAHVQAELEKESAKSQVIPVQEPPVVNVKPLHFDEEGNVVSKAFLKLLGESGLTKNSSDKDVLSYIKEMDDKIKQAMPLSDNDPLVVTKGVIERFYQLKAGIAVDKQGKGAFETKMMSDYDLLRIAHYVEVDLRMVDDVAQQVLKKRETGLSHTLQTDYDSKTGKKTVYIFANHKVSQVKGSGALKKVVSAIAVTLANYQEMRPVARVFTKVIRAKNLESAQREVEIAKAFGFAKMETICEYRYESKQYKAEVEKSGALPPENQRSRRDQCRLVPTRISMIYELADGSLGSLIENKVPVDAKAMFVFAKDINQQLGVMHARGFIHGDVKPDNILYRDGRAQITDFGSSGKAEKGKPLDPGVWASCYNEGLYQTIPFTAPELFANPSNKEHFKADTFAAGVALYQLRHRRFPKWALTIDKNSKDRTDPKNPKLIPLAKRNKAELKAAKEAVARLITEEIEVKLKHLDSQYKAGKPPLTLEEKNDLIMYHMLRLNPDDRYTQEQLNTLIADLENRSAQEALDVQPPLLQVAQVQVSPIEDAQKQTGVLVDMLVKGIETNTLHQKLGEIKPELLSTIQEDISKRVEKNQKTLLQPLGEKEKAAMLLLNRKYELIRKRIVIQRMQLGNGKI